jgi:hypothetical protein
VSEEKKTYNPFRDKSEMEDEIKSFLNKHRTFLSNQAERISDYFQMCCYNYIVRYYTAKGYDVSVENLIGSAFKYKLSPAGYPENFSYFKVTKMILQKGKKHQVEFEIHHNLTVQSSFQDDIFLTPDISVINANSIISDQDHYLVENSSKKFCYVKNRDLQTFCEVKQFNPFPELIFSFTGLYSEMFSTKNKFDERFTHIAPSLLISGKGKEHTEVIKSSIEKRYPSNIVFDLFESGSFTFSNRLVSNLTIIPSSNPTVTDVTEKEKERLMSDEDLPF